jgi:WD40 repeat protein
MQHDDTETYAAPANEAAAVENRPLAPLQVRDRGRYQVIAEHGRGGIGRVLRATDREFGRDVAVKELLVRTASSEMRFMREALITARLEHPNIVPVHEAGRWDDGTPFYAMKLVAGRPLKALIAETTTYAERLKLLDRVLAVTDAIAYAHDRGVIHRDLKPSNIIVGDYGETIVIDWGLAKAVGDSDEGAAAPSPSAGSDLTVAGAVLGTPAYMAPEQASGDEATARSDVYALGAIVLDVLRGTGPRAQQTGRAASSGETSQQYSATEKIVRDIPDVPADLRSIVWRAMALAPADRYATARAFGDDLRRFLGGATVDAHRYNVRERTGRWLAEHRRLTTAALAIVAALFVAAVISFARESRLREAAESAAKIAKTARLAAEEERARADRQTLTLMEEQARTELADQHPFRAAVLLADAYRRDPTNLRIRWLLSDAIRSVESLRSVFDVRDADRDPDNVSYAVWPSRDERTFLTGHRRDFALWDAGSGRLLNRWRTPEWEANLVRYNDDESLILNITVPAAAGAAKVMHPHTGDEISSVPVEPAASCVVWSGDARWVAALHPSGRLQIWSAEANKIERTVMAAPNPVFGSVAFNPASSAIAVRGVSELMVVDIAGGLIRRAPVRGEDIQVVTFSTDGALIATSLTDRSVQIWDSKSLLPRRRLAPLATLPLLVSFSPDSSITTVVTSKGIHLFDTDTGTQIAGLDEQTRDQTIASSWSRSGWTFFTVSMNGNVRLWDFRRSKWANTIPIRYAYSYGTFLDGDRIALTETDEQSAGIFRLWDGLQREVRTSTIAWQGGIAPSFSGDGSLVLAVTSPRRASLFDTVSGKIKLTIDANDDVTAVAISRDGRRVAVTSNDGELRIISLGNTDAAATLNGHVSPLPGGLAFSPSGHELVWGNRATVSTILDARSGRVLREIPQRGATFSYSADGSRILVTGHNGDDVPKIWNTRTGEQVSALESGGVFIVAAALNADGTLAATAADGEDVRIWDASTGRLLRSFAPSARAVLGGNVNIVKSVSFSSDSRQLLATSGPAALVWNIAVDGRSADELAAVVAGKSPWRLVDGRLKVLE